MFCSDENSESRAAQGYSEGPFSFFFNTIRNRMVNNFVSNCGGFDVDCSNSDETRGEISSYWAPFQCLKVILSFVSFYDYSHY